MAQRVVVVGGGVSGLTVSFELLERRSDAPGGIEVLCLEAAERPGGNIRTDRVDGFLVEWGPNGFLDNVPATLRLARRVGLEERLLPADPAAQDRFIFRAGRLRKLPTGPLSFLLSDALTVRGRLRVLCEPFGPSPRGDSDESVFDFAARRIGGEAARVLVSAMVTGIYAGDAKQLSLRATFPKMWQMEHDHGTLTRAMFRKRREARRTGTKSGGPAGPGGKLTSFRLGLQELIDALARAVGPALHTRSRVLRISHDAGGGYRVDVEGGESIPASAVVLSCPSWCASEVTGALDGEMSRTLSEIPPASLAVVHLGYGEGDMRVRPDGFGYLVPRGEGPRILGTIWASSIFPGRAPAGKVLLTTMVGGAHDPEAVDLGDDELLGIVRGDLRSIMGIDAAPCFVQIFRHPHGIPQYTLGHRARLEAIERRLENHPGVRVSGNSYRGISVNSCADEAPGIADAIVEHLRKGAG